MPAPGNATLGRGRRRRGNRGVRVGQRLAQGQHSAPGAGPANVDAAGALDAQGVRPGTVPEGDAGPGEVHPGPRGGPDLCHARPRRWGGQDLSPQEIRPRLSQGEGPGFALGPFAEANLRRLVRGLNFFRGVAVVGFFFRIFARNFSIKEVSKIHKTVKTLQEKHFLQVFRRNFCSKNISHFLLFFEYYYHSNEIILNIYLQK